MEKETYILFNNTHTVISLTIPAEVVINENDNSLFKRRILGSTVPILISPQNSVDLVEKTGMSRKHLENCDQIKRYVTGNRKGFLKEVSQIVKDYEESLVNREVNEICEVFIKELHMPDEDPMIEDEIEKDLAAIEVEYGILIEDEIEEELFEVIVEGIEELTPEEANKNLIGDSIGEHEPDKEVKKTPKKYKKAKRRGRPTRYSKKVGK